MIRFSGYSRFFGFGRILRKILSDATAFFSALRFRQISYSPMHRGAGRAKSAREVRTPSLWA